MYQFDPVWTHFDRGWYCLAFVGKALSQMKKKRDRERDTKRDIDEETYSDGVTETYRGSAETKIYREREIV